MKRRIRDLCIEVTLVVLLGQCVYTLLKHIPWP